MEALAPKWRSVSTIKGLSSRTAIIKGGPGGSGDGGGGGDGGSGGVGVGVGVLLLL